MIGATETFGLVMIDEVLPCAVWRKLERMFLIPDMHGGRYSPDKTGRLASG